MVKRQGKKPHRITQSEEFSIGTFGDFCTGSDIDEAAPQIKVFWHATVVRLHALPWRDG
jgi:hypothetical protein